jgi:phosphomannomutase
MAAEGAIFGGEHSAHFYFRDFWNADTGMLAAMHVLAALGEQSEPLSEVMGDYTAYKASGEINSTVDDAAASTAQVAQWARDKGVEVDELDGLTLTHAGDGEGDPMWWLNLRASNTEPLLRLNVEAADADTMAAIRDDVLSVVRGTARGN